jgi:mannose-6-phosphate isomerase
MMIKIEPRPYKLLGKIQNYEWGTKNGKAYIASLLGLIVEKDLPYAEYWIGVHPKAPSELLIGTEKISLIGLIENFPIEILGRRISDKFNKTLPFLLKILSINKALSIQSHPSKELAKELHKKDSKNYPDDNHKPEIAIAIDHLEAIVGLKNLNEIKFVINENPELKLLFKEKAFNNPESNSDEEIVKKLYSQIMQAPDDKLEECILLLSRKYQNKSELNKGEEQFLLQYENFGIDIGLISLLLFNFLDLRRGEAIFTPAGIPHAYIKGNIVECMANSDNVVRAGLTPKFKDIKTLTEMLEVDSSQSIVDIRETENKIVYKTSAEEFEVEYLKLDKEYFVNENDEVKIIIIIDGEISLDWDDKTQLYTKGEVILIPAILNHYQISKICPSTVYIVKVPS